MASMRLTYWLIVLLLAAWCSNAHTVQDENAAATTEVDAVSRGKGVLDGERTVIVAIDQRLGGRRMGAVVQVRRLEKVKATSVSEGGVRFAREYENKGDEVPNAGSKKGVSKLSEEVDQKEFVAFNADYCAPRHHPPKNN